MSSNGQTAATNSLLFAAATFLLPPHRPVLPSPKMLSMNPHIGEKHPWTAFNRSLSSLCTLKASANNVFGIMLLPTPREGLRGTPTNVETVTFLCADNWGPDPRHNDQFQLRPYVKTCLMKILDIRAELDRAEIEGRTVESTSPGKRSFITHVYSKGWAKFCERMKKNNNRGRRLLDLLQRLEHSNTAKPANFGSLIGAVSRVLDAIYSPLKPTTSDYIAIHNSCTQIHRDAFEDCDMNQWISGPELLEIQTNTDGGIVEPMRILQKMVKLRNGIENLMWLIHHPKMRLTFKGAQAVAPAELITWVESPKTTFEAFEVDLRPTNRQGIWRMYNDILNNLPPQQKNMYASTQQVWLQIKKGMDNINDLPLNDYRPKPTRGIFRFSSGQYNQHCEGKLVSHVIQNELLGKVFPYIGCSKRCCEPCFTVIQAVNTTIKNLGKKDSNYTEDQCFVVSDTHRKVYPFFGITPISKPPNFQDSVIQEFHKLLCLDIGLVVKAGSEKGLGDSDSGPEPVSAT